MIIFIRVGMIIIGIPCRRSLRNKFCDTLKSKIVEILRLFFFILTTLRAFADIGFIIIITIVYPV